MNYYSISSISKFCLRSLLAILTVLILNGQLVAQNRLFIGFTKQEALTSLALNQDWQQKEMGKIFWPLLYDQLWIMGPGPQYKPLPGLATHWKTEDYKTWVFHLNSRVHFSDQIPVSADDTIFSLLLFQKQSDGWNPRSVSIESYTVIDENTLEVTLHQAHSGPYPPFYRIPILPRHVWKKYEQRPQEFSNHEAVGSGPYLLKEFKPGELLRLVRNEDYHDYQPRYDELVLMSFANKNTLYGALKSGLIDFFGYEGIDPAQIREFDSAMGVKTVVTDGMELYWLTFNLTRNSAIRNIEVRKALMSGIDRGDIIQKVFSGYAKEVDSFVYPELVGYNPAISKTIFNQNEAKQTLDRAGYTDSNKDGLREDARSKQDLVFTLLIPNSDRLQIKIAEEIKKQIAKIGIKLNLMKVDSFMYNNFLRNPAESGFDIALNNAAPGPYQDWIWNMMKSDEDLYNQQNHANYVNYAFDRILDKLLTTPEPAKKFKYLFLMQEILADDLPYGLLIRPYKICPVRQDRMQGLVTSMGGISSEINLWNYITPLTDAIGMSSY